MEYNARFCLFCMQKLDSPILMDFSFPFPRFSGSKIRVALGILLVALIGSGAAILVSTYAPMETPSNTSVFSSQPDTETSSSLTASLTPKPSNTESSSVSTSSSSASSLLEEEQNQMAAVTSQTSGLKEESNFKPSSSQPESFDESVSSSSLPNMTAQEMMDAIFEKERNTLSKKYPNLTWSDEELGEDSSIEQTQIYYGVKTLPQWESDYQINGSPLELIPGTTLGLVPAELGGHGVHGSYHWKILECTELTDDLGTHVYFFKVEIQRELKEVDTVEYGVHTLTAIQNIRAELSKTGTRIDILPQYAEISTDQDAFCANFSCYFDLSGMDDNYPSNQQELEKKVVEMAKSWLYPGCLYDIRFLYTAPTRQTDLVEFYFSIYVK